MREFAKECLPLLACAVSFGFIGFCAGGSMVTKDYQKQAIKRGHAQYNQTTGAWEWKDSGKGEGE